jgi:hypothetical protein
VNPPDPITRLNAALVGRYRIESELGEGGMATVYLADDLKHERKVALKVLKPELAAVVGAERFLAEIKTTANLQHPHILPLHDSGEADSFLYYVMPYIEGETLRDRLVREKQLPVDDAVRIATDVAEALHSAHEQGVIHRDIKPANILLSKGRPLVADFGIALAVSAAGGGRLTETGLSLGTPYYMSPEQASADREPSAASDVYSLGCVLYEMLVGEPPYTGGSAQAVLAKILTEDARAPTKARPSIPANVDAAIGKALEKLPADRFAGAQDFARALADPGFRYGQSAAEGVTAGAGPVKRLTIGVAGLAVLLGLLAAWGWLRPIPVSAPIARFELPFRTGLNVFTGNGVGMDLSRDGSSVVFVGIDSASTTQLWLRSLDQLVPRRISGTVGARNPRFSPDGQSVAFTANNGLSTVSLSGTPPISVLTDSVPDGGGGIAWGPDGMLYFRKEGLGIWRVPADGGSPEQVTELSASEVGHDWLDVLPNGKGVLFSRDIGGPSEDEIAVVDLESGEIRTLFQGAMGRYAGSGHVVYASGDGTLLAAPFDMDRLAATGPARAFPVTTQVKSGSASQFALDAAGGLLYWPGSGMELTRPEWVSVDGVAEPLDPVVAGHFHNGALSPDGRKVALTHAPLGGEHDIWIYDLDQSTFSRLTREGDDDTPFWSPDSEQVGYRSNGTLFARAWDGSGGASGPGPRNAGRQSRYLEPGWDMGHL